QKGQPQQQRSRLWVIGSESRAVGEYFFVKIECAALCLGYLVEAWHARPAFHRLTPHELHLGLGCELQPTHCRRLATCLGHCSSRARIANVDWLGALDKVLRLTANLGYRH